MHVVRSDGEPLKIDQKAVEPDKDAFETAEFKINLNGKKKKRLNTILLP